MMTFIIKREDGGVSVGQMIDDADLDDIVKKWNETAPSKSIYHQLEDRFPNDDNSYFFDVYDHSKDLGVFINMDKAKIFHVNKLRDIRAKKFIDLGFPNKLNQQLEDAIVDSDTKAKLKELRDFPQKLDLSKVTDPDVLRNIIPDCLK